MKQEALIKELMSIPGKVISLHDGAYLYREGAPAHYFYIVRSGHIFVVKYGASGRVLALRLATKGSLVGELPIYEDEPTYLFSAIARSAAEVYAIEFPVLEAYLEKHPHLAVALLKLIGMHMRKQHLKFRDLVLYGKKGALCSTLLRLANSYGMDGGGDTDLRTAHEPGARELLCIGAGKSQPHALRAEEVRCDRYARASDPHQGYRLFEKDHPLRELRGGDL